MNHSQLFLMWSQSPVPGAEQITRASTAKGLHYGNPNPEELWNPEAPT